jgi:hypothetical protein
MLLVILPASLGQYAVRPLPPKTCSPLVEAGHTARVIAFLHGEGAGLVLVESPGRPSSTNGCAVGTCAATGCRTFALDRQAARPASTADLGAILVASTPGGDIPP